MFLFTAIALVIIILGAAVGFNDPGAAVTVWLIALVTAASLTLLAQTRDYSVTISVLTMLTTGWVMTHPTTTAVEAAGTYSATVMMLWLLAFVITRRMKLPPANACVQVTTLLVMTMLTLSMLDYQVPSLSAVMAVAPRRMYAPVAGFLLTCLGLLQIAGRLPTWIKFAAIPLVIAILGGALTFDNPSAAVTLWLTALVTAASLTLLLARTRAGPWTISVLTMLITGWVMTHRVTTLVAAACSYPAAVMVLWLLAFVITRRMKLPPADGWVRVSTLLVMTVLVLSMLDYQVPSLPAIMSVVVDRSRMRASDIVMLLTLLSHRWFAAGPFSESVDFISSTLLPEEHMTFDLIPKEHKTPMVLAIGLDRYKYFMAELIRAERKCQSMKEKERDLKYLAPATSNLQL